MLHLSNALTNVAFVTFTVHRLLWCCLLKEKTRRVLIVIGSLTKNGPPKRGEGGGLVREGDQLLAGNHTIMKFSTIFDLIIKVTELIKYASAFIYMHVPQAMKLHFPIKPVHPRGIASLSFFIPFLNFLPM